VKVLLDECLPQDLRHALLGHEVHTAQWAGFQGMKNGDLLRASEDAGYQVLLTVDRGGFHISSAGSPGRSPSSFCNASPINWKTSYRSRRPSRQR